MFTVEAIADFDGGLDIAVDGFVEESGGDAVEGFFAGFGVGNFGGAGEGIAIGFIGPCSAGSPRFIEADGISASIDFALNGRHRHPLWQPLGARTALPGFTGCYRWFHVKRAVRADMGFLGALWGWFDFR
jgi:hypothetical protein